MLKRYLSTAKPTSINMTANARANYNRGGRPSPYNKAKPLSRETEYKPETFSTESVPYSVNSRNAIDKLSHIALSEEQQELKARILKFTRESLKNYKSGDKSSLFVIQGDAGTGKSVILNALFNDIQKISKRGNKSDVLHGRDNYLVVNHPEMLKLYHRIAKSFHYLVKRDLERPTSLVNRLNKEKKTCDVVVVDEAHLLATAKNGFKRFYADNHLEELMKLGKVLVIVYDDKQSLRMDQYWSSDGKNGSSLDDFLKGAKLYEIYYLKQQFRVTACQDVQDWILQLSTTKKILPHPTEDLKKLQAGDKDAFDFKVWDNCQKMYEALQEKDKVYGQCRMLSTYDFPYRIGNKDWFVTCEDFRLRWDRFAPTNPKPWSEREDTIEEVGSVYTVQGFDLNYAAVILGRSVGYDKTTDSIKLLPEYYDDRAGFTKRQNITSAEQVKEKIILNSINVLLTRGVRGLYVYAWDKELRERLSKLSREAGAPTS